MKFKNYIETESGIKDTGGLPGTAGQVLSSTVTGTSWIEPDTLEASSAKLVVIACKNTYGSTINKGTPVYQTGTVGATDIIEIAPADALISSGNQPAIGLLQTTLNDQGFGNVVITGELLNFTTDPIDGVTPTTGDKVFLKSGGGLTLVKPTGAGNAIQNLGLIGKVSGGSAGSITVSSIMRANDVPNLPTGRIWIGDGNTIVSDTVYVDEPNGRVGIGTTTPLGAIQIGTTGLGAAPSTNQIFVFSNIATTGGNSNLYLATGASGSAVLGMGSTQFSGTNTAGKITYSDIVDTFSFDTNFTTKMVINGSGNVGIGTTNPNSKLQVDGEIDANGGDGYRINGKPWAAESSNNLRLGDWDGEGFSTSIFDENTIEILKVKDRGVIINNDRTNVTTYGADASLVVGGDKFSPWGPGVVTLLNNDPSSQTNDSTGTIQFAIRDDQNTSAGYTSASIRGSISFAAGSGSSGGGILDFLTSSGGLGSSPTTHMRIDRLGNVGIGTTNPLQKLHVSGSGYFQNGNVFVGTTSNTMFNYITTFVIAAGSGQTIALGGGPANVNNNVLIGNGNLKVSGSVQLANDTAAASASKVGTFRYRTASTGPGTFASYVDMCMQTGSTTYAWVNIVTNSW